MLTNRVLSTPTWQCEQGVFRNSWSVWREASTC